MLSDLSFVSLSVKMQILQLKMDLRDFGVNRLVLKS